MKVCEMFTSIQGESSYAGLPCTFIRLTGCNLRCAYCDTEYAFAEGREMSRSEVLDYVRSSGVPLVEITGGEPLMQPVEVSALIRSVIDAGYKVLIETNGSLSIRGLDPRAVVILDLKTPSSGMSRNNDLSNLDHLKPFDEIKFVISDRNDYEWSKEMIESHGLAGKHTLLFSPVGSVLPPRELARWVLEDRLPGRLNLQIHKYIFGLHERGV
ncbi:MAG: radical SAM protein [Nitrospirae bacterium]|nr:radical SAM protein [Nitrospirota bacterium]